ncbi:Methylamine utilization protein MauE [Rubellimicrobium thermophilum DSM 16684]|uniref:Methylamine utilization protein MauE n=2 Tax=Rubellimicrobium TaxID=295418 RepID=S9SBQ9_9RHOB|nr:Methylamine utilization protein MauE [Rubellimicrobium thermophilum DSM 16684]
MGGAGALLTAHTLQLFLGFATALLALQKLRDIEGFATGFLGYDLLAQRWVPYARLYPWAEALVGLLMVAGAAIWLMAPVALFIGGIGAISVFKAVYVDRRELRCACVGAQSNVPLGFVSLTENLVMIGMAVWMVLRMV